MQMPIRVRRIVGSAGKAEKLRLEAGQRGQSGSHVRVSGTHGMTELHPYTQHPYPPHSAG